ncbi:MAG: SDR family NAD(P)-dependent oxidoreductase [Actinomycetia bacterium]|nr:SDR family NAD(P)-dependent oxidoreductase [Actinomycetes bacterium]
MSHKQYPLDSGFGAAATAADVLAGVDLSGTNVIITGGHAGVGLETTRALAEAGASVTVGARSVERAHAKVADLDNVDVGELDLLSPASIDAFVARWLDSGRQLHILINNAGVPASADLVLDDRGYEEQFATNHLGHFQLTLGLLPALRAAGGGRVVNVSSGAQRFGEIRWDDPNFATGGYDANVAYAQSKLANVLFTVELDRRTSGDGVHAYAVHPGVIVGTNLNSSAGEEALRAMGLVDEAGDPIIDPENGKKTPQQGASTSVFAATSPLLADVGGVYLADNDIAPLDDEPQDVSAEGPPTAAMSHSIDPESARRLWELSEKLLAG